ncbi:putative leader peptide [Kitasatospora paranensis]|uniref:Leader peptide n=1 Tax=Kitasatospora paranensis TaxID=258053 RepID=A0ABW2FTU8_9ACTN
MGPRRLRKCEDVSAPADRAGGGGVRSASRQPVSAPGLTSHAADALYARRHIDLQRVASALCPR